MAENKVSLKWIDGNDVISSGNVSSSIYGQDVNPTFNVDQPYMWPPLSVLSGLASGFCERMAVAQLTKQGEIELEGATVALSVLNNTTPAVWTCAALESDEGYTSNAKIAENVVDNLALANVRVTAGTTTTQDIYFPPASSPIFRYPINSANPPAGQTNNYMMAFDNALQTILDTGVYKTNKTDNVAYQFSSLVNAASSAATAATSSVLFTPPVSGGGNYTNALDPAFPSQWAKERKWMLEQLRYTGVTEVTPLSDMSATWLTAAGRSGTTSDALYSSAIANATLDSDRTKLDRKEYVYLDGSQTAAMIEQLNAAFIPYNIVGHINKPLTIGTTVAATVYFGTDGQGAWINPYDQSAAAPIMDNAVMPVSGATITAVGASSSYAILPGRTVTFIGTTDSPLSLDALTISSGAHVIVNGGAALTAGGLQTVRILSCNIMNGGTYSQDTMITGQSYMDARQHVTYDYMPINRPPATLENTGPVYEYRTAGNYAAESALVVGPGTVTVPATSPNTVLAVYIASGGTLINKGSINTVMVGPGGKYINSASVYNVSVFAGGQLELHSGDNLTLEVFSGGTLTIASNWYQNGDRGIEDLFLHEGAVVIPPKTGGSVSPAPNGFVRGVCYREFHNYGLQALNDNPISAGWNLMRGSVYAADGATGCFCRLTPELTSASAKTSALATTPAALVTAFGNDAVTWLQNVESKSYIYECSPLAINGIMPGTGPFADHYPSFRVRQFPTDEEVSSTFPS